jgi:hypothetical protein
MIMAQQGYIPITITLILLTLIATFYIIITRKQRKLNQKIFNNLSIEEEKLILKATHNAAKHEKPTGNAIVSAYENLTGKSIELNRLAQKLNEAENAGLVTKDIVSQMDEPVLVWKTQISFPKK